jgi:hypothetical protein
LETKSELSTGQILDSGIDYLRISVKPGQSLRPILDRWHGLFDEAKSQGHDIVKSRFLDYRGTSCAGMKILTREDGMLFEAQGAVSNRAFAAMEGVEFDGNIPRLDAHATVKGTEETCPQPERVFDYLRRHQAHVASFRSVNLELKRPAKTGHTCYIGSRSSSSFVRVYDAGAVHSDRYPKGTVRWELETHNATARDAYTRFQNCASVPCCATSLVMGKLIGWDIHMPWFTADPPIYPMSGYKPTDDERKLRNIQRAMVGSFRHLMNRGYAETLAELLGVMSLELRPEFSKFDHEAVAQADREIHDWLERHQVEIPRRVPSPMEFTVAKMREEIEAEYEVFYKKRG